ncbi:hypothetical protein LSAT2_024383 [Lamellibrachia satsuma]|nr:hypothetical protein LSAT2_024383 [Lamellibrachia satsuma]
MDLRKQKMCAGGEKCTDYVLIFSRSSGSPTVHYLVVDRGGRVSRLLPKLSTTVMKRIENIVGYRVVVLGGFLYVVGGRQMQSGSYVNLCYQYNPRNGQWARKTSLSEPRTAFTVSALGGRLYVCGGRLRDDTVTSSVECYDPVGDVWTEVRSMPAPRAHHASCVAVGRLFVSGGVASNRAGTDTFWQYDPTSDFWSQADDTSSLLPRVRQRHLMSEYRGAAPSPLVSQMQTEIKLSPTFSTTMQKDAEHVEEGIDITFRMRT